MTRCTTRLRVPIWNCDRCCTPHKCHKDFASTSQKQGSPHFTSSLSWPDHRVVHTEDQDGIGRRPGFGYPFVPIPRVQGALRVEAQRHFVDRLQGTAPCLHKKLLRDLCVHEVVLAYRLADVRLRSEDVRKRQELTADVQHSLQLSQEEIIGAVTSDDDAMHRLHALTVAFENVGVVTFAKAKQIGGVWGRRSLGLLARDDNRRMQTVTLAFIVMADEKIRR